MRYNFPRTEALLNSFGNTIISKYKEKIAEYSSGKLFNTINFTVTKNSSSYTVTINLEEYYTWIEHGRKAGSKMPPVDKIQEWIEVRQIIPRPYVLKSGVQVVPTIKQLAYVIARSIAKNGIQARPYMKESIEYTMDVFKDKLVAAVRDDVLGNIVS